MQTMTMVSTGAFWTGRMTMRWMTSPPRKAITSVAKKATQ